MMPAFIVEAQLPDGSWEAKCIAKDETAAQLAVKAGRVLRRIQGVKIGEWRILFVPKEEWS